MFDQQGVWVLPNSNAFGYPNAMLAKLDTTGARYFDGKYPSTITYKHNRSQVL